MTVAEFQGFMSVAVGIGDMDRSQSRALGQVLRLAMVIPPYLVGLAFVALGGTIMAGTLVAITVLSALAILLYAGKVLHDRGAPLLWGFATVLLGSIVLANAGLLPWGMVDHLFRPLDLLFSGSTYEPIIAVAVIVGALVGLFVWLVGVHDAFETGLRAEPAVMLVRTGAPVIGDERRAAATVERLAMQVDRPVPAVRILDSPDPICYTLRYPWAASPETVIEESDEVDLEDVPVGRAPIRRLATDGGPTAEGRAADAQTDLSAFGGRTAEGREANAQTDPSAEGTVTDPTEADHVVVVSTGLIDRLPPAELEAVLAHEVAHLANGDLRLMNWLLLPTFWADAAETTMVPIPVWSTVPIRYSAVPAVAFFNRGREFVADAAAARITGDPAALASALERLDEDVETAPESDFRAVAIVNILPTRHRSGTTRSTLPRSHPPTAERIERLETMTVERECA